MNKTDSGYLVDGIEFEKGDMARLMFGPPGLRRAYETFGKIHALGADALYVGPETFGHVAGIVRDITLPFNISEMTKGRPQEPTDFSYAQLTKDQKGKDIDTSNVSKVSAEIDDYFKRKNPTVTLLEPDPMILYNGTEPVIRAINYLSNRVQRTPGVLLVRTDPGVWKDDLPRLRAVGREVDFKPKPEYQTKPKRRFLPFHWGKSKGTD